MMIGACGATLTLVLWSQFTWPTLAEELKKHNMEAVDLYDADQRITGYQVLNEPGWFAIAYYWDTGLGLLPDTLHVRNVRQACQAMAVGGARGAVRFHPPASSRRRLVVREWPFFSVSRANVCL